MRDKTQSISRSCPGRAILGIGWHPRRRKKQNVQRMRRGRRNRACWENRTVSAAVEQSGGAGAGGEAEGGVWARASRTAWVCTSRSFYSENHGKITKGFKHGGDIIKCVFLKKHYGFSMENIGNRAGSGARRPTKKPRCG